MSFYQMDAHSWRQAKDSVEDAAIDAAEGSVLSSDMSRRFSPEVLAHIADTVLPDALDRGDAALAQKCERVLAKYGLAKPNGVSGLWAPLDVPRSELQVRELFASRLPEFGFHLVGSHTDYPDWLLLSDRGEYLYCEVEHRSSSFFLHGHATSLCDMIACWEHDWSECPLPVLEFFSGQVIEPAESAERSSPKSRERLSVNFTGRLATPFIQPNFGERKRNGEYAVRRYNELIENASLSTQDICQRIGAELGKTSGAVRQLLQHRGIIGKQKASKRKQVRDKFEEIRGDYDTKAAAVEAVAEMFGIKSGTVWSHLSRSKNT